MSSTSNPFQQSLIDYLGGTTGGALGPGVVSCALESTTSSQWKVGKTTANDLRGVDIGASVGAANTAFIDMNSLDSGTNDFDTRILSFAGEAGVNGRGSFVFQADSYTFNGNGLNAAPLLTAPGALFQPGGITTPVLNQNREFGMLHVAWSGEVGTDAVNPALVIQLKDPVSNLPYFGHLWVTVSNGYQLTGNSIAQHTFSFSKSTVSNVVVADESEGNDLTNIYASITWGVGGFPVLNIYNKIGGASTARYMITGTIFPLNDGF